MGNRDYKQFGAGEYFHIYNRGNEKKNIFLDDDDFRFFLLRLRQNLFPELEQKKPWWISPLPSKAFSLICYCLMPNHFHLLVRQNSDLPTSKLISKVCTSYAMGFNKKYKRVGHLFQDQFKQVLVGDNSYLAWLSAYIHQNPVVAGLVSDPLDYKWSSFRDFLGVAGENLCEKDIILNQFQDKKEYKKFVAESYEIIKTRKDLENFLLDLDNED